MSIHDESSLRTRAFLNRELFLGRGKHTGRLWYLAPDKYNLTHLHVIGAPGYGKSFYTEHLVRSFTDLRIPASLIDPHGDQAKNYYQYLVRNPRLWREQKILRFAPGAASNNLGFNPFDCNLPDAEVASLVLEAFMKVWGEATFNETPRLERILRAMFHMFAANNVPLTQAYQFLLVGNRAFRAGLLPAVDDERVRQNWGEIEQLPKSEKLDRFESSWNRLQRFLALPAVAELFAAEGRGLRFPDMLERGEILVADLSGLSTKEAQSLVGTMMVNALYYAAKLRPEPRRSCVIAIDEFPKFVTTTIAESLDELRKFGVRFILAHQHLSQLTPQLRGALMGDAKIKVVFGGLAREDAEILARELFTGEVRGDHIKHIARQTKFRPVLEEREVEGWSETGSESDSESDGWSDGYSHGSSASETGSRSEREIDGETDGTDATVTNALSSGSSSTSTSARSVARTRGSSRARGYSRSSTFVTNHDEFCEETGRQYWSLEEQWEKLVARLMKLDRREAIVKVFNRRAFDIETPEIRKLPALSISRKRKPKPGSERPSAPPSKDDGASPDGPPEDFRE
ncbi:MAG: type IV secretion system DNA-binding domain-containing protein [Acidobacteriia bacterium]|nr:type IV secretion system DNA-binding domain-containing protein [Terriglobia bacterium]